MKAFYGELFTNKKITRDCSFSCHTLVKKEEKEIHDNLFHIDKKLL